MKKVLLVMTALMLSIGVAQASHVVDGVPGKHIGTDVRSAGIGLSIGLVLAAVGQSNAQGVLPCHSKPNVKVSKGGYSFTKTDCSVNGFK